MSEIKNGGLDLDGAEPFEQQQFETAGVEGVKLAVYLLFIVVHFVIVAFLPPCLLAFSRTLAMACLLFSNNKPDIFSRAMRLFGEIGGATLEGAGSKQ